MTQIRQNNKDAYGLILDAIDIGVYKPGDRLVESELAIVLVFRVLQSAKRCSGWKHNPC